MVQCRGSGFQVSRFFIPVRGCGVERGFEVCEGEFTDLFQRYPASGSISPRPVLSVSVTYPGLSH